ARRRTPDRRAVRAGRLFALTRRSARKPPRPVRFLLRRRRGRDVGRESGVRTMATAEREGKASRPPPDTRGGSGPRRTPTMPRNAWLWFALILVLNFAVFQLLFPAADAGITIPYTVFREQVVAGNVAAIYNQGQSIEGRFREPVTYPEPRAE